MSFLIAEAAGDVTLERCVAGLNELLAAARPRHLLLVLGQGDQRLVPAPAPPCRVEVRRGTDPADPLQRYDAAVLFGVDAGADRGPATHMLAALRDVHARQLLVVPATEGAADGWSGDELRGLGLNLYAAFRDDAGRSREIYGFNLSSYKSTPRWLNSRYWANPELFGKFRW